MHLPTWERSTAIASCVDVLRCLRLLACIVLLALSACVAEPHGSVVASNAPQVLTRDEIVADVEYALLRLADIHPNLYWRVDRVEVLRRKEELIAQLPDRPSALQTYLTFMALTAAFDDAHVGIGGVPRQLIGSDGKSVYDSFADPDGTFPATFDTGSAPLRIASVTAAEEGLNVGDTIVSINGVAADDLLSGLERIVPGGPMTKRYAAREQIGGMLWALGIQAPYRVEVARKGMTDIRSLTLPSSTRTQVAAAAGGNPRAPIEYRLLDDNIGLIGFYDMTESPERFMARLVDIFDGVEADRPQGLIIDLRSNHGGNSMLGDMLLAFISDKAYRPFAERRWKVSRTCQEWYAAMDDERQQYFKEYLMAPIGETLVAKLAPERRAGSRGRRYDGPTAVLIGPGTISSAAILADAMKSYRLAMIFGQPINEPANMYGEVCQTTLPNSGIRVRAPSALFIRADGDAASSDPVMPDVFIDGTPDSAAIDPALDAARAWLQSQTGS